MKISQLIFFGFLLILLLFSITTYINYQQSEAAKENADFFAQSTTIVRQSNRFQRNTLNAISGLRGYLLTGEKSFIQIYDSATIENERILKELKTLLINDTVQQVELDSIIKLNSAWIAQISPLRNAQITTDTSENNISVFNRFHKAQLLQAEKSEANNLLQSELRKFINVEYSRREINKLNLEKSIQRTKKITFNLTLFSIIAGGFIAGFLAYGISSRILKMVSMANSIASGNYNVYMKDAGKDELGKLANSLNHMAKVLDENFTLLKRKNEELDQFAHIVSHDMKAPLRGIDNVVSWIEEDHDHELTPKLKDYLQLIKGRIVRAENLISGILSYARVGKEVKEKELVDIKQMIEEIQLNLTLKPGIELQASQALPVLNTERLPLFQVFSNLVGNAAKYHNKEQGYIKVYHTEQADHYTFFVEDNGPGIATNYHNKIFVIFQTLQERDSFESTGVGLAIVKKILDARKEKIMIQSKLQEGSIFSFTWNKNN